jgi:hypothetical protein
LKLYGSKSDSESFACEVSGILETALLQYENTLPKT